MKTYNSSDLSTGKRSKILDEAAENGVIIQEKKTNGVVRREFVVVNYDYITKLKCTDSNGDDLFLYCIGVDKLKDY